MKPISLDSVCQRIGGRLLGGDPSTVCRSAKIDSRKIEAGDLFFALSGERVHGTEFVAQARSKGAVAAVLAEGDLDLAASTGTPLIVVRDPATALAELAASVRIDEEAAVPAVAITGSVGKTTTCRYASELVGALTPTHRPPASFNNELGVPLTILGAPGATRVLISEVGANACGEVHKLASWVRPKVGIVTAIGPAHLEGFGSIEAIQIEKLSLLDAVVPGGSAFIPTTLAEEQGALVRSLEVEVETIGPGGTVEVRTIAGRRHVAKARGERVEFDWTPPSPHSARNLEAALAAGIGLGFELEELTAHVGAMSQPELRGETRKHAGVTFQMDCYNANPTSVLSAIDRLENERVDGRRVSVLGPMDELGDHAEKYHREIGQRLANAEVDRVFFVGDDRCRWYDDGFGDRRRVIDAHDVDEAAVELSSYLKPGDTILFKASRTQRLEDLARRIADLLEARSAKRA